MNGLNFPTAPKAQQPPEWLLIISGDFWPVIDLNQMRATMRIDATVTPERLHHTAIEAVAYVNDQLAPLLRTAQASGISSLAAPADPVINGESIRIHRYRRAVYCYTKALLLESYADYDATGKSAARADAKQEQAEDYRREGHHAIADLLHRRRIDAELI